jgi:glycosyltransferase involved in cell wall biosynthesis
VARGDVRSVLIAAQLSPPSTLVAARRVAGLTKYLSPLGYSITVLTSVASGQGPIEGAEEVVRTADALASPLNWRRRHFEALGGGSGAVYATPSRLESVVVPDLALAGWVPFALSRALRLTRGRSFDCVLTSSPPQSAHLLGLALRRRGVPWIAELRDGWTFEPPRPPWPSALQRRLDEKLERHALRAADAVVAVTQPIVEDLRSRLGIDAVLITNGFDPEEQTSAPQQADPLLAPDRHSFVHTGRMALARSTPQPLLDALRELSRSHPEVANRLEVVFAGPLSREESEMLAAPDLAGLVRVVGSLDRRRALELQRAADTLLVITEGASRRSVATGKLFEYLAAGRPILVLGEETEAARIVKETKAGSVTSAVDPGVIAEAIRSCAQADGSEKPDASVVGRYGWDQLGPLYGELIESVCADRTN